ncbi:two-component system chemotaxis response regulator CheB [Thermovibrio guaymasensis]|uniref:protein-glutamate methylesterase n=1 Tax=Thermovibrio guaymasensis TaxID=240167 RepID=A0A420W958_9BACT|nr:CheB methylesterase domain-containing protein [Thermovibrio guaymasensis]RKQ63871.1 two-component system chemotaxis response regulator CheB [Thermovibrio guaymasensis]
MTRILLISSSAIDRVSLKRILNRLGSLEVVKEVPEKLVELNKRDIDIIVVSSAKEDENVYALMENLLEYTNIPILFIGTIPSKEVQKLGDFFNLNYFFYIERDIKKTIKDYEKDILQAIDKLLKWNKSKPFLEKRPYFKNLSINNIKIYKNFQEKVQPNSNLKFVLIGASTGGPRLIEAIARSLPENYPYPICVVQHMPTNFTSKFASRLDSISKIKVVEARDGEELTPGKMIIGKGGKHLHFTKRDDKIYAKLVPNTRGKFFCPSVDEMFFSAKEVIGGKNIMAVLLTGIGDDGAEGMVALKKDGAYTIAESEETAAVYGMPKEAYVRGGTVKVLSFPKILEEIIKFGYDTTS